MKIIFLCSGLEPGRDGVGDYTRRLGVELIRQGHLIAAVSLNDKYVSEKFGGTQHLEGIDLPVLRLPSALSQTERFNDAKKYIDEYNPEWLSLQFVIFGFHPKGIPFGLTKKLTRIGLKRPWHVMFHELYIGTETGGVKSKIISYAQRYIIKKLIYQLKPKVVHTSLPEYFHVLKKWVKNIFILPIFSNIPFGKLEESIVDNKSFRIGFFSQINAEYPILEFLQELKKLIIENKSKIEIILIGGKNDKNVLFKRMVENYLNLPDCVTIKGYLPAEEISYLLQTCKLGITPLPRHSLGKSGSVAAFLSHGVPVAAPNICPGFKNDNIGFMSSALKKTILLKADLKELNKIKLELDIKKLNLSVSDIAGNFIDNLTSIKYE